MLDIDAIKCEARNADGTYRCSCLVGDGYQSTSTVDIGRYSDDGRSMTLIGTAAAQCGAHWSDQPAGRSGWYLLVDLPESMMTARLHEDLGWAEEKAAMIAAGY